MNAKNNPDKSRVVIIVENDGAVANSLKFALELEGYQVFAYRGAVEVLNSDGISQDGCFVVDYHLPAMNGLAVIERLRAKDAASQALLTASHPSAALRRKAAAQGIPIVEKPFLGTALLDAIRNAMNDDTSRI
jgi:two-component system response regulator FixJ